jgi:hypothetical protein
VALSSARLRLLLKPTQPSAHCEVCEAAGRAVASGRNGVRKLAGARNLARKMSDTMAKPSDQSKVKFAEGTKAPVDQEEEERLAKEAFVPSEGLTTAGMHTHVCKPVFTPTSCILSPRSHS